MTHTFTHAGRWAGLRASLLALAILAGACDSADKLSPEPTLAAFDSIPTDSSAVVVDTLAIADSLAAIEASFITTAAVRHRGTPFGPDGLWASYKDMKPGHGLFTASLNSDAPSGIIQRINAARRSNHQLMLVMAGGSHSRYITRGRFDLAKWKARMNLYRTPAIKAAVAAAVADGTVLGNNMMDEPNHPSWGGVMTKPLLDKMAAYVKGIFPSLPAGVSIRWDWRPQERYKVVDFIVTQYVSRFGSVTTWRNNALAAAKQNRIALVFAFNPINGGSVIRGCPLGRTGGKGTYGGNCRMTPSQVKEAAVALGGSACALVFWKYDAAFMSKAANVSAFKYVASKLAANSRQSCRRAK